MFLITLHSRTLNYLPLDSSHINVQRIFKIPSRWLFTSLPPCNIIHPAIAILHTQHPSPNHLICILNVYIHQVLGLLLAECQLRYGVKLPSVFIYLLFPHPTRHIRQFPPPPPSPSLVPRPTGSIHFLNHADPGDTISGAVFKPFIWSYWKRSWQQCR